jgi:hypothetical protein
MTSQGEITEFSAASRRRMLNVMAKIEQRNAGIGAQTWAGHHRAKESAIRQTRGTGSQRDGCGATATCDSPISVGEHTTSER